MHHGQNRIDHEGKLGIFIVRYFGETFLIGSTWTRVFIRSRRKIPRVAVRESASEFLLPVLTKPDIARVIMYM